MYELYEIVVLVLSCLYFFFIVYTFDTNNWEHTNILIFVLFVYLCEELTI